MTSQAKDTNTETQVVLSIVQTVFKVPKGKDINKAYYYDIYLNKLCIFWTEEDRENDTPEEIELSYKVSYDPSVENPDDVPSESEADEEYYLGKHED